jgi:hypothetical protein
MHIQEKDEMDLRPVFTEDGITYIYIKVYIILNFFMSFIHAFGWFYVFMNAYKE